MAKETVEIEILVNAVKSSKSIGDLKENVKNLDTHLKATGDTTKTVQSTISNFGSKATESFKDAAGGVNVMGTNVSSLFKMILGNPIGLLITAFVGLLAAFKRLEPVANAIEGIFAGITAAFDTLIGGVGKFFADIMDGKGIIDSFSDNISGLTDKMIESAKVANDYVQAMDALEDSARANSVESAKLEGQINKLLLAAKDRTKTEKERLNLLDQASQLEKQKFNEELKIAQKREALEKKKYDDAAKNGKVNDEIEDAYATAQIARINLENSSLELNERIANRRNVLEQGIRDEIEKTRLKEKEYRDKKIEEAKSDYDFYSNLSKKQAEKSQQDLLDMAVAENNIKQGGRTEDQLNEIAQRQLTNEEIASLALMSADKQIEYLNKIKEADEVGRNTTVNNATNMFNSLSAMAGQSSVEARALALAQIALNEGIAISNAVAVAFDPKSPMNWISGGWAAVANITAFIGGIVASFAQVKSIVSQKFELGGLISGPSHRQGGIQMGSNELEGNEIVLNRQVAYNPYLRNLASAINQSTGGKDFSVPVPNNQNNEQPMIVQVSITEKQVTDTQQKVERIKRTATI